MTEEELLATEVLEHVADLLDIPRSHYEKARDRYNSVGGWLHRPESEVFSFDPEVFPQGSFRYGTVIRPLFQTEEYDLDLVCRLALSKARVSQAHVKTVVGEELKAYVSRHDMHRPAEEKNRCWRIDYADEVSFHMDILPAVPGDDSTRRRLERSGVSSELAALTVAITDRRHPGFWEIQPAWPNSNPRGFARWFENRMRPAARARRELLVRKGQYASIDRVPSHEWKTPLQRSIQILKRHRDVMFLDFPDLKPISMIVTTLAAESYGSESDLFEALSNILDRMPSQVREDVPRVPNPVNPDEDFADKWTRDSRLEKNFWTWHAQAKTDLRRLVAGRSSMDVHDLLKSRFELDADRGVLRQLREKFPFSSINIARTAPVVVKSGPKPWGDRG